MSAIVQHRFLTKSRFKLAIECPTKLFYTSKLQAYVDTKLEDDFLAALAEGGFQVGELAKLMFPGGHEVNSLDHDEAIQLTEKLLQQEEVIIFEAAVKHENQFVRIDVLRKKGNLIDLIEVKAKSFDSADESLFRTQKGGISKPMLPYLQDIAFQCHVSQQANPEWHINSFLMLVDKSKTCTVDGLNQKFKIRRTKDARSSVQVLPGISFSSLGNPLLTCVNVDDFVKEILQSKLVFPGGSGTFTQVAQKWAEDYRADRKIAPAIGANCSKCEFRSTELSLLKKSGFHECLGEAFGLTDAEINEGTVLDIWNFSRKQELLEAGTIKLNQVTKDQLKYEQTDEGLSRTMRQWMQVSNQWPGGGDFYLDRALVQHEVSKWQYPLHFIDFETARVAIPFFAGQKPYANIAFQFSHHILELDGTVAHKNQFLEATPGSKPNYEFVRRLQQAIGNHGTVLMWFPHENSTLNAILDELEADDKPPLDAHAIKETILNLTVLKKGGKTLRSGDRAMVDLCRISNLAFFHPSTKGSSSIKKVLPAVMSASSYLRERYSKPIYGAVAGVSSLNFVDKVWWIQKDSGTENPYSLLPPVFSDISEESMKQLESDEEMSIAEGGAATTAYARLQFENLDAGERKRIEAALLRYCELDTLAMVMILQAWLAWL